MSPLTRRHLLNRIAELECDSLLFEPVQMRRRMEVLDELDSSFGEARAHTLSRVPQVPAVGTRDGITSAEISALLFKRVDALRNRLEAANSAIYRSIRRDIRQGAPAHALQRWIQVCGSSRRRPRPGLSYDHFDELISGVLHVREPAHAAAHPDPEKVFYQPTPARHILRMMAIGRLSGSDVFVDLGSGLGHTAILVAILTGARAIGIEAEAAYVRSARACAGKLGLRHVSFVHQDARDAEFSVGTVFYLYTPFTGSILAAVLRKLRDEASQRPIRICSLGPCTLTLCKQPWLKSRSAPSSDQVACFRSAF